jgi:hypothetical protein
MAFGVNRAHNAEADRLRALQRQQATEVPDEGGSASPAPSAPRAPARGFRPGGQGSRPAPREEREEESLHRQPAVLPVEDGVSSVQVIRRLLEVAAVARWPQDRVAKIEALAHEDPDRAWSQVSADWEKLCARRRASVGARDGGQVVFRIVSADGEVRESRPTGPRANTMSLLHGLELLRQPLDRAPFSAEVMANVHAEQRRLRSEALAAAKGEASGSSDQAVPPPPVTPPASNEAAPASAGEPTPASSAVSRFSRQPRR